MKKVQIDMNIQICSINVLYIFLVHKERIKQSPKSTELKDTKKEQHNSEKITISFSRMKTM